MNPTLCQTAKLKFIDEKSAQIFEQKEHLLIGISPNNSYYNEEKIEQILIWAFNQNFKKINVFLADEITFYNWLAKGKTEKEAKKKTREEDNKQKNRLFRVFEKYNISKDILIKYENIKNTENYQYWYKFYRDLFYHNPILLTEFNKLFHENLQNNINSVALEYFFCELPLIVNVAEILNVASSCVVYHRLDGVPQYIYEKNFFSKKQGFLALKLYNE